VGHGGVEISNSFICSKFSRFAPEGLVTTLFQNGCSAFRPHVSSDLCLQLKSSIMSASFQAWSVDLETAASSTSLLPVGMQTAVASIKTRRPKSTWLLGMPFLTAMAVPPFLPGKQSV
jgi:hypothetical protein